MTLTHCADDPFWDHPSQTLYAAVHLSGTDERDAIREAIAGYDPDTLARWQVQLNVWLWPGDCPLARPEDWNSVGIGSCITKSYRGHALWEVLDEVVPVDDFSRAHWLYVLGKTAAEWQDWWDTRQPRHDVKTTLQEEEALWSSNDEQ